MEKVIRVRRLMKMEALRSIVFILHPYAFILS
jgi:hypothetical protein